MKRGGDSPLLIRLLILIFNLEIITHKMCWLIYLQPNTVMCVTVGERTLLGVYVHHLVMHIASAL